MEDHVIYHTDNPELERKRRNMLRATMRYNTGMCSWAQYQRYQREYDEAVEADKRAAFIEFFS